MDNEKIIETINTYEKIKEKLLASLIKKIKEEEKDIKQIEIDREQGIYPEQGYHPQCITNINFRENIVEVYFEQPSENYEGNETYIQGLGLEEFFSMLK